MELRSLLTFVAYVYFWLNVAQLNASEESGETMYGEDWLLFPDDDGGLHYVNMSALNLTPSPKILERNVYFHLYTQRNPYDLEELFIDSNTTSQYFDPVDETKFITHGWLSSGSSSTVINIKDAYLKNRSLNAIIVDWNEIAVTEYVLAATSTNSVGSKVSQMAQSLMNMYNVNESQFHFIGHSLGAHVMGYAGEYMQGNNVTVARITGLDPARPLFEMPPSMLGGISSDDAVFVDIIHTCAGVLGIKNSRGTADFYPNGGTPPQPGCDGVVQLIEACSHGRSHEYFVESINSEKGFVSNPCGSYSDYQEGDCRTSPVLMGDPIDTDISGDYYLRTNSNQDYARGAGDADEDESESVYDVVFENDLDDKI